MYSNKAERANGDIYNELKSETIFGLSDFYEKCSAF